MHPTTVGQSARDYGARVHLSRRSSCRLGGQSASPRACAPETDDHAESEIQAMNHAKVLLCALLLCGLPLASVVGAVLFEPHAPPQIADCTIFPEDNIWNVPIDTLPVAANSAAYVETIGQERHVHADFGAGLWAGGPIGIPYVVVSSSQPGVAVQFEYDDESDPGPYPIPTDAPIEGGPNASGDRHVLVLEADNCVLYEVFAGYPQADGSWKAGSGAVFDLKSHTLRPDTWTSADAAGLPILPGLVRYEEVASGEIHHAIRFTAPRTRRAYVWPARHYASNLTGAEYPPLGQRFRLKADYDISGFSPEVQTILRAMQRYGLILADNGSAWYISGVPDERWNNQILRELHQVEGAAFEAVDVSSLQIEPDSGQARSAQTPTPTGPEGPTATPTLIPTAIPRGLHDTFLPFVQRD